MPTKVALHLGTLSCGAETEQGSEPYVWPIMIAEEGGVFQTHVPPTEWAAKVLVSEMVAGQSIPIPSGMDSTLAHVFENKGAGLVAFVVVLFEKDSSPEHGSVAVLRYIEERSLAYVKDHLGEFRQSSGERGDLRYQLALILDPGAAESAELSWLESAVTYVSPGGFDDSVGLSVWALSGGAITDRTITFNLSSSSELFLLTGNLGLSIPPVDLCRAERAAVAQAKAVVQGLQGRRAALQQELQHATPQQKPAIVAAINKINQVELPAAEAALAAAEAALEACVDRFGRPTAPLDNPVIG